jgi:phage baseplate assembly protein gpV
MHKGMLWEEQPKDVGEKMHDANLFGLHRMLALNAITPSFAPKATTTIHVASAAVAFSFATSPKGPLQAILCASQRRMGDAVLVEKLPWMWGMLHSSTIVLAVVATTAAVTTTIHVASAATAVPPTTATDSIGAVAFARFSFATSPKGPLQAILCASQRRMGDAVLVEQLPWMWGMLHSSTIVLAVVATTNATSIRTATLAATSYSWPGVAAC